MQKSILVACTVVALGGITAAAQQPRPATPPTPPTQQTPPDPTRRSPPDPTQQPPDPLSPSQRPPNPDRPMPDSPRPMADVASSTTVTGCLKTWDSRTMAPATGAGSGAGSAGASASAAGSSDFVLTNVQGQPSGGKGSFLLKTSDTSISFAQHLNHKVTVTGSTSDAAKGMGRGTDRSGDQPGGDKPSADRDASASGRVGADDAKLPTLNVTSLKMISPTCGS